MSFAQKQYALHVLAWMGTSAGVGVLIALIAYFLAKQLPTALVDITIERTVGHAWSFDDAVCATLVYAAFVYAVVSNATPPQLCFNQPRGAVLATARACYIDAAMLIALLALVLFIFKLVGSDDTFNPASVWLSPLVRAPLAAWIATAVAIAVWGTVLVLIVSAAFRRRKTSRATRDYAKKDEQWMYWLHIGVLLGTPLVMTAGLYIANHGEEWSAAWQAFKAPLERFFGDVAIAVDRMPA